MGQAWSAYGHEDPSVPEWHGTMPRGERDATGTLYRRARYYDPQTGRFTQEDPTGLAGGVNLYGYSGGDPVNLSDPSGQIPVPLITALIGAGIGGYIGYRRGGWGGAVIGAVGGGAVGAGAGWVAPIVGGWIYRRTVRVLIGELTSPAAAGGTVAGTTAATAGAAKLTIQFGKDPNQVYHAFRHVVDLGLDPTQVRIAVEQHLPTVVSQLQPGKPLNQIIVVSGQRLQYTAFQLANGVINVGRIHAVP